MRRVTNTANSKAAAGRARKQETASRKADEANAALEAQEDQKWQKGAKGKSAADDRNDKAADKARKKAELQRLQEEEEASLPSKVKSDKKSNNTKPSARKAPAGPNSMDDFDGQVTSFSASNLDDAIEAMSLVNDRDDAASRGSAAASLEKHPERRVKAAFEAYKERQLPIVREEHPGLRLQQYNELLFKQFQKAPENPFNQLHVSYDATKDDRMAILQHKREHATERLKTTESRK